MRGGGRGSRRMALVPTGLVGVVAVAALIVAPAGPARAPARAQEPMTIPSPTPPVEVSPGPTGPTGMPTPIGTEPTGTLDPTTGAPTDASATPTGGTSTEGGERGRAGRQAARAAVSIVDDEFRPMELTVVVGTEAVWTNQGQNPHTVTADDRAFDSGTLESGQGFSVTFDRVGQVPYYCQIHGEPGSGMFGIVIVRAAPEEEEDGDGAEVSPTGSDALAGTGFSQAGLVLGALVLLIGGLAFLRAGRRVSREGR